MAVKDRSQLLTDNASVFGNGKNTRGDDEKTFNDDQLDSVVMKSGDTFAADAEFAFQNGSKLREGAIDHGYGGGIARVCANEKADQWEDGFKYLISTSGSTNTVIYTENINNDNPEDTDDETLSYAVGSKWKNLVSGVEYLCTNANEGSADWQAQSGVFMPSADGPITASTDCIFTVNGNIATISGRCELANGVGYAVTEGFTLPIQPAIAVGSIKYTNVCLNENSTYVPFKVVAVIEDLDGTKRLQFTDNTSGSNQFINFTISYNIS